MSRARHHMKRAAGGLTSKPVWNAGGEQNAAKEAEERKHGGHVKHHHGEGEEAKSRHDRPKRARGGKVEHEKRAEHHKEHHRAKGGRVRGEGIGADMKPLSSAAKVHHVTKNETPEEGVESD